MKFYYKQGGVTIYHGDCLDILPRLKPIDHVITDPPYFRDVYLGTHQKSKDGYHILKKLAAGDIGSINDMISSVSNEINRLVSRWALVFSDVESSHIWRSNLENSEMRYVRTGAWVKPNFMPQLSGDRPAVGFEAIVIAHTRGRMSWNGGGTSAVWTFRPVKGITRPDHPTVKPLSLMRKLVTLFSDEGDTILDPFMGSGTTLRAAKDYGRKAIGIEIEERYCEIAANRMEREPLRWLKE